MGNPADRWIDRIGDIKITGRIGLITDSVGNLYIDEGFAALKVSQGVIITVAGNGAQNFRGDDGPATNAQLI